MLRFLHSKDIVFADLRTNNILSVASEHHVVLIDFDWPGKNRESRYPVMLHSDELVQTLQSGCGIYCAAHDLWPLDSPVLDYFTVVSYT